MSSVNFPSKPNAASVDFGDAKQAAIYQEKMAAYNLAIQTLQSTMNQEQTTQSNMAKSRSDAMEAIIANFK